MARIDSDNEWFDLQHAWVNWLVASRLARWATEVPDVGRAPLIYTPAGRKIQPDILSELAHEGELVWMDEKGKSDVVYYRNRNNCRRTGIDWVDLVAYREVVARTERPCLVCFIHVAQREVRYIDVNSALWQRGHDDGADMVYVDYDPLPLAARWNGDLSAPKFELATNAFVMLPLQRAMDGFLDVPQRRIGKGYATLAGHRPPKGVKGWPPA